MSLDGERKRKKCHMQSGKIYCSAAWCSNNSFKNAQLTFHRFPLDAYRCKEWLQNCKRTDLMEKSSEYLSKNCYLCSAHFEPSFLPKFKNQRARLARSAKPTIFPSPLKRTRLSTKSEGEAKRKRRALKVDQIKIDHSYAMNEYSDTPKPKFKKKGIPTMESLCWMKMMMTDTDKENLPVLQPTANTL